MRSKITSTNVSFDFLKESGEFMHSVLDNITNCVLLLNNKMELQAFNDPLRTIFSSRKDENLLYIRCGEAIGCAYQVDEAKDCGKTSHCCKCELRLAAVKSYLDNIPVYKENIVRPFYNINHQKEDKHLEFSTRLFVHQREKYIMMIVSDVTKYVK